MANSRRSRRRVQVATPGRETGYAWYPKYVQWYPELEAVTFYPTISGFDGNSIILQEEPCQSNLPDPSAFYATSPLGTHIGATVTAIAVGRLAVTFAALEGPPETMFIISGESNGNCGQFQAATGEWAIFNPGDTADP